MKPASKKNILTTQVLKNGSVNITQGRKLIAYIAPEIFTEGWAKNTVADRLKAPGFDGIVALPGGGRIGLQTVVTAGKTGIRFRFAMTPLDAVKVIHIRLVINLPYKDWWENPYTLGKSVGRIPTEAPKNNRLAESQSVPLTLGPSAAHNGLVLRLKAPGLYTVLQDNRQWTPFLHAFVNRHEPNDHAWKWAAGDKKVYGFTLHSFG
jgi:hypothetical protein